MAVSLTMKEQTRPYQAVRALNFILKCSGKSLKKFRLESDMIHVKIVHGVLCKK